MDQRVAVDRQSEGTVHSAAIERSVGRVEARLGLIPMPPVELLDLQFHILVEAIGVEAPTPWMRPRLIKAFHAAAAAEQMLRCARSESIASQRIPTGQKLEVFVRHHDVQKAG